mgnify:CR=1 FL=1
MKRYTLYIIGILIGCAFSSCRKIEIVVPSEYELVSDGIHPEANPQGMYLVNEGNMGSNKCTLDYLDYGNLYNVLNRLIRENSKPVIGAVNGHALGGGNVLVLSCDIIVASERAKFAVPEINLGIFGGASVLPRIVGRYQAAEMVLFGEAYTAQRGYELGIVNKVVAPEEVVSTAAALAESIKAKSPLAVRMAKRALTVGNQYEPGAASEMQLPLMSLLYSGHDQKEGMQAFFEKREPQYTGR